MPVGLRGLGRDDADVTAHLPIAEIVAAYEAGEPSTKICKRYGVSSGTVVRYLKNAGVKVRGKIAPRLVSVEVRARIIELHNEGNKRAYIAAVLGLGESTVSHYLKHLVSPHRPVLVSLREQLNAGREAVRLGVQCEADARTRKSYKDRLKIYDAQIAALDSVI